MEREINIPEIPECRFFVQDEIIIKNLTGIEIGMVRDGKKYGIKIPSEWDSKYFGKIDISTLTHRERIIGGVFATLQSELEKNWKPSTPNKQKAGI